MSVAAPVDEDALDACMGILAAAENEEPMRKQSRVNFCWNEDSEMILINLVVKNEAHHKTKHTMETKWNRVKVELLSKDQFKAWQDCTWQNLRAKFQRMLQEVQGKYALTAEGSNLSGLPERASDRDQMLIGIAETLFEEQQEKEGVKNKELLKQV